ncbi:MAG: hypothetical protein FK731_15640 [Asgard group archaeon]|nr:hypothetical protein [Asgard group archaeon]
MKKNKRRLPLSIKEKKFCEFYLEKENAFSAALAAGYKGSGSGCRLIKKPEILEYIKNRQVDISHAFTIKFEEKVKKLVDIIEGLTPEEIKSIKPEPARVIIAAIAELNRMQGDYPAEKRVNANLNVNTDADLQEIKRIQAQLVEKYKREY